MNIVISKCQCGALHCAWCGAPLLVGAPMLGLFGYWFCDAFCANEWIEQAAEQAP